MRYPIAIKPGDASRAFTVTVPDMPGCVADGDSLEAAISNAREAITLWLQDVVEADRPIPRSSTKEELRQRPDYRERRWVWVDIDMGDLDGRLVPVEIWLPRRLERRVRRYLDKTNVSMTQFASQAMMLAMGQGPKSLAARRRAREVEAMRASTKSPPSKKKQANTTADRGETDTTS